MKLTKEQLLLKLQENPALTFADLPADSCDEEFFNAVKEEFENPVLEEYEASPLTKNIGQLVRKEFEVSIKELSNGHLQAIINSGQEDRHGEILDMKGLDIKKYMTNPILANGHDYTKYSVGRTWKLVKTKLGELIGEFTFATDVDKYDDPKILDQLYRKGYQFAFSIGFIPLEVNGNTYTKSQMIEFSPVLIGADAQALLKSKDILKKGIANNPILKGGDNMKLTKEQIKTMLKGDPTTVYDSLKDIADEDVFTEAKAEVEAETKAALEAAKKQDDSEEMTKKIDELTKQLNSLTESVKAIDAPEKKNINIASEALKDFNAKSDKEKNALKFLYYARGLQTGSFRQYLNIVGKDAMNTGDTSDVLPPAEFIAEVERLEEIVGIARKYTSNRQSTNGNGITFLKGDDDLEIFDTAESGVKKSTKLSYAPLLLEWRKFAGILPITDELTEDSAVDLWNDATKRFARAFTRQEDIIVLSNSSNSGKQNYGVLHESGVKSVVLDEGMQSLTYDNLVDMVYGVPTPSEQNGRFYFNREIASVIMKLKDDDNRPIWQNAADSGLQDGSPGTILGKPYSFVESMPNLAADATGLPFLVFGDLSYVTLGERTGLNIIIRDTGIVGDPDEVDQDANTINLFTQDAQAMRAVKRFNAVVRFPAAFAVATTGNHLS